MDCNIQVKNFQFSSITCRLCLSENLSAPYTDLSEDVVKAEDIRHVLTLQYSLHDNLHHPRHVCSTCTATIDAFTALKDLALINELILHVKESYSASASPDHFASDSETEGFHGFTESEMETAVGRFRANQQTGSVVTPAITPDMSYSNDTDDDIKLEPYEVNDQCNTRGKYFKSKKAR